MMLIAKRWFLRSLLIGIHALGVAGILASGSSSGGGNGGVVGGSGFTCGLSVQGIAPVGDGTVWVGVFAKTDTDTEDWVVELDTDGSELDSYFIGNGGTENAIRAVARATDGTTDVYVGGDFSGGILRLNDDGTPDDIGFNDQLGTGFNGRVTSIAPLATGEVYVGGYFTEFDGNLVSGLVRLQADGSWDDMNFITIGVSDVESVALATDIPWLGFVYSGGSQAIAGNGSLIGRWGSGGGLDGPFVSVLNPILSVVPAADTSGDIYAGGSFADGIVRLNDNGSSDVTFAAGVGAGFDNDVLSIGQSAITSGIYVGGAFTTYNGFSTNGVVRLNNTGIRDNSFGVGSGFADPDGVFPFSLVASVVEDPSNDVFVGGGFTQYKGTASNGIVRLNSVGDLVNTFDVSITIDGEVCDSQTIPD